MAMGGSMTATTQLTIWYTCLLYTSTTTVTVLDGTVLPDVPNLLVLGTDQTAETVLMTAKEGNVLTIERGFQGTPKAWNAGTEIARNFTGYDLDTTSENIEAVAEQTEETANLVNGVQSYKSLSELSATASTDLLTIFAAMATPSRLVCDIANGSTAVYPGQHPVHSASTRQEQTQALPALSMKMAALLLLHLQQIPAGGGNPY